MLQGLKMSSDLKHRHFFFFPRKIFFFVSYNWINAYMKFSAFFMECLIPTDNRNNADEKSVIITIKSMKKRNNDYNTTICITTINNNVIKMKFD